MAQLDAIRSEVERFYRRYMETFNRGDAAAMLPYLAVPFVMVTGDSASGFDSERAVLDLYERIYVGMKADGWTHSTIEGIDVTPAGERGALAVVTAARVRGDGTEMMRGKALYSLQLYPDAHWRVAAIIADFRGDFAAIR